MQTRDPSGFGTSSQSRLNLQRVFDSLAALQLRLASSGPRVGSNPGLLEDVSKSSGSANKRAPRGSPFASDLSAVLQDSGIELVQNQTNFTVYVEGLEKLFHARG